MQSLKLFVFMFAVPLGGIFTSGILATHLERQLHEALLNAAPRSGREVDSAFRQRIDASTATDICGSGPDDQGLADLCGTYRHLRWIRNASSASLFLGLFLVAAPWAVGLIARSSRRVLVCAFKPGMYGTLVLTAVLIVLNAAILIASLHYLAERLFGGMAPLLLLWLGVGAIFGAGIIIWTLASLPQRASMTVLGLPVSSADQPELWAHVQRLAEKIGAVGPDNLLVGFEPRFFVTESDVSCLVGELKGRTMFVSLAFLRMLSLREWSAAVAHELSHFRGLDTAFALGCYRVFQGTQEALSQLVDLSEESRGAIASFAMLPGRAALDHFHRCFSQAESQLSRESELRADAVAAEISSSLVAAGALVKFHAYAPLWDDFIRHLRASVKLERECPIRQSVAFVDSVAAADTSKLIKDLAQARAVHAADSHPSLGERLDALGIKLADVMGTARVIKPVDSAAQLLTEIDRLDEELSQALVALLARDLGIQSEPEAEV